MDRQLKGHKLSVTCIALSANLDLLFSGSKDGSIIKCKFALFCFVGSFFSKHLVLFVTIAWCLGSFETGMKMNTIKKQMPNEKLNQEHKGHRNEVLCLALSDDGKFLASSGRDKSIKLWDTSDCHFIYNFEGHRDVVTVSYCL